MWVRFVSQVLGKVQSLIFNAEGLPFQGLECGKRKQSSKSHNSGLYIFRTRTVLVGMFEVTSKGGGGRESGEVDLSTSVNLEREGLSIKEQVSLLTRNTPSLYHCFSNYKSVLISRSLNQFHDFPPA